MRRPTTLDWLGATAVWGFASIAAGIFMVEGVGTHPEVGVMVCLGVFLSGIVAARLWVLRRPVESSETTVPRVGLTTAEMTAQRLADMEARIYELEERLELAERLLARAEARPALPLHRDVTPV